MKVYLGEDLSPVPQATLAHHPHWLMQLMNALMAPPSFFQPHIATFFHMVTRPDMQTELMTHKDTVQAIRQISLNNNLGH